MNYTLGEKVAVVTGASRGGGKGIAQVLGEHGAVVYVTGRSTRGASTRQDLPQTDIESTAEEVTRRGGVGIAVRCDHTSEDDIAALFDRVQREQGKLDLLVNNAWGGYERYYDAPFDAPFWEQPLWRWDAMFQAGVRSQMVTTRYAVPFFLRQRSGLIIHTTAPIREKYHGNVFYDVAKTAVARMTFGMSHDLREYSIPVIALAPGWMRTESMSLTDEEWPKTESVEYVGRAVAALASDADAMNKTGEMHEVGDLARGYGFTDIDGRQVPPFSELFPEWQ